MTTISREWNVGFDQPFFLWIREIKTLILIPNKAIQDPQRAILIFELVKKRALPIVSSSPIFEMVYPLEYQYKHP